MKIALVITGLGMGGAETQVADLADCFASQGHEVLLICLGGEAAVRPRHSAIRVVLVGLKANPFGFWRAYFLVRRVLADFDADVVHSNMVHANIFCRLLRLATPMKRLICSSHSSFEGGRIRSLAYRLTDCLADINTNVSQDAVAASVRNGQVSSDRMMVVYNGVDCNRFRSDSHSRNRIRRELCVSEGTQVFLAVGRFEEAKDYPNLMNACVSVFSERPDSMVWIVGKGSEQSRIEALADELEIRDKILFLGLRRDIPALMNSADIFVLSSAWEGFSLVVAEAMACERLVVSTDCGGVREVLGAEGIMSRPRDSQALACSMIYGLNLSDEARDSIGRAARSRVLEKYSLVRAAENWLHIYNGQYERLDI